MGVTLQETVARDITVRLVERGSCDFVILYLTRNFAAINFRTTDRAVANQSFDRAVSVAALGFAHPAWKPIIKHVPITTGEWK
jgi:hypothetical protein